MKESSKWPVHLANLDDIGHLPSLIRVFAARREKNMSSATDSAYIQDSDQICILYEDAD